MNSSRATASAYWSSSRPRLPFRHRWQTLDEQRLFTVNVRRVLPGEVVDR